MRLPALALATLALSVAVAGCGRLEAAQAVQNQEAVRASQADQPITGAPAEGVPVDSLDADRDGYDPSTDSLRFGGETRLRNVRQLTFGGNNAEAYWSPDGQDLVFQSDWDAINPRGCDQQFVMSAARGAGRDGSGARLVSAGLGRTTCGYYLPDGRVVYASTQPGGDACPVTAASVTGRYVWDIFPSYDIYVADPSATSGQAADGSNTELLVGGEGYDAEMTVSPDGRYAVFTSTRSGDLELWRLDLETGALLQLTDTLGYDGGAFFSPDGTKVVWRASRPTGEAAAQYQALLEDDAVTPGALNLFVANADGSDARQITDLPGANWAPFFHPSGEQVLFASNHHTLDAGGREFDLFLVDLEGGAPERVTFSGTFDAFPMFSPDGTRLVFASNRRADRAESRETNVFVADWVETPTDADRAFQTLPAAARPAPPSLVGDAGGPDAGGAAGSFVVRDVPTVSSGMRGEATGPFSLVSLGDGRVVLGPGDDARADSASTAWDLGFRGTSVVVNGGVSGPGEGAAAWVDAPFEAVTAPPPADAFVTDGERECPRGEPTAVCSGSGNGWYLYQAPNIVPAPDRTLVVRLAGGGFAKVRFVSYYRGAPEEPGSTEPRFYTVEVAPLDDAR